mmetsp:Transcript_22555/g.49411  ORF Transcript_22555/g.49411 Transcript_22555/m.49411 type:complete len:230 (+) Transcript_22555:88-777(+)
MRCKAAVNSATRQLLLLSFRVMVRQSCCRLLRDHTHVGSGIHLSERRTHPFEGTAALSKPFHRLHQSDIFSVELDALGDVHAADWAQFLEGGIRCARVAHLVAALEGSIALLGAAEGAEIALRCTLLSLTGHLGCLLALHSLAGLLHLLFHERLARHVETPLQHLNYLLQHITRTIRHESLVPLHERIGGLHLFYLFSEGMYLFSHMLRCFSASLCAPVTRKRIILWRI